VFNTTGMNILSFGKKTYNPMVDIMGPLDTYKTAGLGYDEVKLGDKFIRIGEGFIEKGERLQYDYHNQYKQVDYRK
jgi:hypothetical protein